MRPRAKNPRSPPWAPEPGSWEKRLARSAKSAPLTISPPSESPRPDDRSYRRRGEQRIHETGREDRIRARAADQRERLDRGADGTRQGARIRIPAADRCGAPAARDSPERAFDRRGAGLG